LQKHFAQATAQVAVRIVRGVVCCRRHACAKVRTLRLIKQKAKTAQKYSTIVAANCTGFSIE
jgi:hypothetical protein